MEVEVVDAANKSVRQQANGRYCNRLLKGGQEKWEVHDVVGRGHGCMDAYRCQEFI